MSNMVKFSRKEGFNMQDKGIVRKIDELGRFVVPKELRLAIGVTEEENEIEVFARGNEIVLKKHSGKNCVFCGNAGDTTEFKGKYVCKSCVEEINK